MKWKDEVVDEKVNQVVDRDRDGDHQAKKIPVLSGRLVISAL